MNWLPNSRSDVKIKFNKKSNNVVIDYEANRASNIKKTCYLRDGYRPIDYVLVIEEKVFLDLETSKKINAYFYNLARKGFEYEMVYGQNFKNYLFIKIHGSEELLVHLSQVYGIEVTYKNPNYSGTSRAWFSFFDTELTRPSVHSKIFQRAPESISGGRPSILTTAERSEIVHALLMDTSFGNSFEEQGLDAMLKHNILAAAYPIHEGPYTWTRTGPLSDRQLLARYWANYRMILKKQPIPLIEKYFGIEVAFYFAWLEYYNMMLVPAAVVGLFAFIVGDFMRNWKPYNDYRDEVCKSKIILCPHCRHYSMCPFTELSDSCKHIEKSFLYDNYATVVFSVFMSVWATVFMTLWYRRESVLKLKWNVMAVEKDEFIREEYIREAKHFKVSKATGQIEPSVPTPTRCLQMTVTHATACFVGILLFATSMSIIIYHYRLKYEGYITKNEFMKKNAGTIASYSGAVIIVVCIIVFNKIYQFMAILLTRLECPRTQREFDNSYIYKSCCLSFANSYAAVIYIAFFKGKFFTHPGEERQWTRLGGIGADRCGISGCQSDLGFQLCFIFVGMAKIWSLLQMILPKMFVKVRKIMRKFHRDLPQWEQDMYLGGIGKYYLVNEYKDLITQYGYVTCFVAAFPLAPLFALIRNVLEIRIDANKFLKYSKRPVADRIDGLGPWNGIMSWLTHISVLTNACVIAFSSNFIPSLIYEAKERVNKKGFIYSTLSVFAIKDYVNKTARHLENARVRECYYQGTRYPPEHPRKYELTTDFFYRLAMQLLFVVIFEHAIALIRGILLYAIPSESKYVKERIRYQNRLVKDARRKILNELYAKDNAPQKPTNLQLPKKNDTS